MRVLDQIAQLILEDPFITAVQIARKLGYAEEKTVYYWIDKGHYQGLTAFKRAVLGGHYHPGESSLHEPRVRYGRLPVIERFRTNGDPVLTGETISLPQSQKTQYAWRYQGSPLPTVLHGDLLLLKAFHPGETYPFCAGLTDQDLVELRRVARTRNRDLVFLDPLSLDQDGVFRPLYAVSQLMRVYQPLP